MSKDASLDLFDHLQTQSMWDLTRKWRESSPVVRPMPGYVFVSRWNDCWDVLRDPATFGNANGLKAVEVPEEERTLGEMDAPRHTKLRRAVRTAFTRRAVDAERPFARECAEALLFEIGGKPESDLVSEFADRLPNLVSLHLLGFPPDDAQQVVDWAKEFLHSDWPALNRTERGEGLAGAFPEFSGYIDARVAERRRPGAPDDVVRRLSTSEVDGLTPSATVLRALIAQIILGGISTSTNLIGSMFYRLLRDPVLHARLRREPALLPAAVEESLRLDPPVLFVMRNCDKGAEIAGVQVEAGERVVVGIASANRDESVFDDAERYQLDRGIPRHISFSGGAHLCVGARLARLVAYEALRAFTRRFDVGDLELAPGFEFHGVPVFLEYGPERLDVRKRAGS